MRGIFFIFLCIILINSLRGLEEYITSKEGNNKTYIIQKKPVYIKEYKKKESISVTMLESSFTKEGNLKSQIIMPENPFCEFFSLSDTITNSYNILFIGNENLNFNYKIGW